MEEKEINEVRFHAIAHLEFGFSEHVTNMAWRERPLHIPATEANCREVLKLISLLGLNVVLDRANELRTRSES
jgi:hypothetical protein